MRIRMFWRNRGVGRGRLSLQGDGAELLARSVVLGLDGGLYRQVRRLRPVRVGRFGSSDPGTGWYPPSFG